MIGLAARYVVKILTEVILCLYGLMIWSVAVFHTLTYRGSMYMGGNAP